MNIESRMVCGKYVEATISEGDTTINTGLMNEAERAAFVKELRRAADDIEIWRTIGYTQPEREDVQRPSSPTRPGGNGGAQPKGTMNQEVSNGESGGGLGAARLLAIATAALERISKCEDAPDIDATGEWQTGLYCGVEDRDCQDRYQGADYGHTVGVEKGLEWASNEAKHALEQMANAM